MDRWRDERITRPLEAWPPASNLADQREPGALTSAAGSDDDLAAVMDISQMPTTSLPAVRGGQSNVGGQPGQASQAPARGAPATRPIPLDGAAPGDDEELDRIREILVGPHLRAHDQRLSDLERRQTDLLTRAVPPAHEALPTAWQDRMVAAESALARQDQAREAERAARARELDELRTELRVVRAELTRERQSREELARSYALAIAELTGRLDRERAEMGTDPGIAQDLEDIRTQHDVLRSELARERMAREEQGQAHARALGALTTRLDDDHDGADTHKHAIAVLTERLAQQRAEHARQFAEQSAEFAARLAAERETAREAERAERAGQAAREERLQQLVAGAERTLAAMQAERQALTAQLAELRLHLLRQASGDGIHRAPGI